ncbi:MAG: phosphate ABC transporter permease subunit PstC [Alphaproteobacteria bacterium]
MVSITFLLIVGIAALGFLWAWTGARKQETNARGALAARPGYHGAYVALWTGLPSALLVLSWIALQGSVIDRLILSTIDAINVATLSAGERNLVLSQIRSIAAGNLFGQPEPWLLAAGERYGRWQTLAGQALLATGFAAALGLLVFARTRLSPRFRARHAVEHVISGLILASAAAAILTTGGILLSLVFESWAFFRLVPLGEFLFGLNWEPQIAIRADQVAGEGAFGAVPVFAGTLLIAVIAMAVAAPIGLMSAIYLVEYANPHVRAVVKPVLELLAGIPTVVYGFFAILVVAPFMREIGGAVGLDVSPNSALAAGAVMGIMILPFISSISDDALAAVPQSMRDGSLAMGATKAETITRVLLPAALPGIVGGLLLAVSRAIGETMIVVMAAGLIANLTANPLEGVTTVTVQIVTLLIGDTSFDNPKTLAAFALGLVLFVATLSLNVLALRIVRKYREKYE